MCICFSDVFFVINEVGLPDQQNYKYVNTEKRLKFYNDIEMSKQTYFFHLKIILDTCAI